MERSRFDRCLTPMGTVPISVIYGFSYPVGKGRTPPPPTSPTSLTSPSRGATSRAVPVWPSSLSSHQSQAERKMKSAVPERREERREERGERNIKSVEPQPCPASPASPQTRRTYQSYGVTLRSRELPKRSYLSSWRESVRWTSLISDWIIQLFFVPFSVTISPNQPGQVPISGQPSLILEENFSDRMYQLLTLFSFKENIFF